MKKSQFRIRIYYSLIFFCFFILLLIILFNIEDTGFGKAIAYGTYQNSIADDIDSNVLWLSILMMLCLSCLVLIALNNANPHLDQELNSFKVDTQGNKKNLYHYLKYCRDKGREYSDVKVVLKKMGWDEKIIRETADKLN